MNIITLTPEHKDLVIKQVCVDCKPTLKCDDPVTFHYFAWTGSKWKRIPLKDRPTWMLTFQEHYRVTNPYQHREQYLFKGDRSLQPFEGTTKVVTPV